MQGLGDGHPLGVGSVRDGADQEVTITDQPHQIVVVHHQNQADALVAHHLSH
ncbi:hypothetical protein A6P39_039530 [Streptomyces sp. FXJ1.172]|nr:hypothetical protein [Streptomyces sp. FXJ1.172]WEO99654.1 hypothetical protein A6P39_039530 [Streptomyces sp. FXJ1.172]